MKTKTQNKLTLDAVLKNFPLAKPRDIQVEALEKTVEAYNKGAEFVVLEAPVGSGKSAMALALAKTMGDSSYMLTLTEQLQDQYIKDFAKHGLVALKGRGKFKCVGPMSNGEMTCAEGKHACKQRGRSWCNDNCPYLRAREVSLRAPHTVANYHSYLHNVGIGSKKKVETEDDYNPFDDRELSQEPGSRRPLLIADECHKIEEFLLDTVGVTVKLEELGALGELPPVPNETREPEPYFLYVEEEILPRLQEHAGRVVDPKVLEKLGTLHAKLKFMLSCKEREEWIPERETLQGSRELNPNLFSLKPLTVKSFGHWVYGKGQRQLFMSGTVLSAWQFCESIGLDPSHGEHIELPSPFPVENRPIYAGNLDMRRNARDDSWPLMVRSVDQLMTHHANEKGIILAPSNEMLRFIAKGLSDANRRRFLIASGETRMQKYTEHCVSRQPTVLAAPGFWEGADLKGDLSTFQIIPAVPRPFFAGQIAARAQRNGGNDWYRWMTYMKLLQGLGRSVRSETDKAVSYVFDRDFLKECQAKNSMVPKWVRDAVQEVK